MSHIKSEKYCVGRISKKKILILFLKTFLQPTLHIENLEFLEFEHSIECYSSVNKCPF